jgi:hypothetical protein
VVKLCQPSFFVLKLVMKLLEITVSGFYGFEQTTTVKYVDNRVICVGGMPSIYFSFVTIRQRMGPENQTC